MDKDLIVGAGNAIEDLVNTHLLDMWLLGVVIRSKNVLPRTKKLLHLKVIVRA
jgi:hypothetical protein